MPIFNALRATTGLLDEMANRLGANIPALIKVEPEQGARAYRRAVLRCGGCAHADRCRSLLASGDCVAQPPNYCRNHAQLRAWADL